MLNVRDLVWEEWNAQHIALHNVTTTEVAEVCRALNIVRETHHDRLIVIGKTLEGNILTVVLNPKGHDIYYPVTARPASRKERLAYREEFEPDGPQDEQTDRSSRASKKQDPRIL